LAVWHYKPLLSVRTDSAFDQQDIGREGVATGRRCLGLPCFILPVESTVLRFKQPMQKWVVVRN